MDWTWFHKWGSPKWFYELSGKWLPWLVGAMVTCLLIGVTWALLFVPQDYQQGLTNRIFYVHVPVASISLAFFPLMAMAGTIFLVWRMKLADVVVKVAAPLGAWFTALALASGSIWGVDTWGTWWVWDGRLTSAPAVFLVAGCCVAQDRTGRLGGSGTGLRIAQHRRLHQCCSHQILCRLVEYASSALDQLHPGDRSGERP